MSLNTAIIQSSLSAHPASLSCLWLVDRSRIWKYVQYSKAGKRSREKRDNVPGIERVLTIDWMTNPSGTGRYGTLPRRHHSSLFFSISSLQGLPSVLVKPQVTPLALRSARLQLPQYSKWPVIMRSHWQSMYLNPSQVSSKDFPSNRVDEVNLLLPPSIILYISPVRIQHHILWLPQIIPRPVRQRTVSSPAAIRIMIMCE